MIPSFPLLSCELSVSVKENLERKIKHQNKHQTSIKQHQKVSKYYENDCRYFESNILKMKYFEIPCFSHLNVFSRLSIYPRASASVITYV